MAELPTGGDNRQEIEAAMRGFVETYERGDIGLLMQLGGRPLPKQSS